jgi:hypothetical protein
MPIAEHPLAEPQHQTLVRMDQLAHRQLIATASPQRERSVDVVGFTALWVAFRQGAVPVALVAVGDTRRVRSEFQNVGGNFKIPASGKVRILRDL